MFLNELIASYYNSCHLGISHRYMIIYSIKSKQFPSQEKPNYENLMSFNLLNLKWLFNISSVGEIFIIYIAQTSNWTESWVRAHTQIKRFSISVWDFQIDCTSLGKILIKGEKVKGKNHEKIKLVFPENLFWNAKTFGMKPQYWLPTPKES